MDAMRRVIKQTSQPSNLLIPSTRRLGHDKPRFLGCYMYFLLAPNILDEVAIVVDLVYTYLIRIQFDYT